MTTNLNETLNIVNTVQIYPTCSKPATCEFLNRSFGSNDEEVELELYQILKAQFHPSTKYSSFANKTVFMPILSITKKIYCTLWRKQFFAM